MNLEIYKATLRCGILYAELEAAKDRAGKAEKACAEMREALAASNHLLLQIRQCDDPDGGIAAQIESNTEALAAAERMGL